MIFSIEDDNSIRELICYTLKSQGYECMGFADGDNLVGNIKTHNPELILLDIMLPTSDGLDLLKTIKSRADIRDTAVIMVSAKDSEIDKVTCLDLGADDYIAKPFGMMELISRVKAVLRRTAKNSQVDKLCVNDITLTKSTHRVVAKGEEISLTLKEYELLQCLMENVGIVITRDSLIQRVWDMDSNIESRTLDVHMNTLRSKLKDEGNSITTVRGVGYILKTYEK